MRTVTTTEVVDDERLAQYLTARDDLVAERALGDGRFALAEGPFDDYERRVEVRPVDGGHEVTQTTSYQLAIPIWGFLFQGVVKRTIRRGPDPEAKIPWWSPADRLDARAARSLSLLCMLAYYAGYLGTLLTQTNTFAKDEFGSTDTEITTMLAVVRVAALLALGVTVLADRRGRRTIMLGSAMAGCLLTAVGALAPNLALLGASQTLARTASTALGLIIAIYAVEEMPAGARAFAVSVLGMTGALGAGFAVIALPLADIGPSAWRILYLLPLPIFVPGIIAIARHLPESRRFEVVDVDAHRPGGAPPDGTDDADDDQPAPLLSAPLGAGLGATVHPVGGEAEAVDTRALAAQFGGSHARRFVLLAGSALLLVVFSTPASQLLNEYLRDEQGFSATRIALFTILTNTPGGIGVVVGGRMADVRGRKIVGAVAVLGGVGFTVLMFQGTGAAIWLWSILGAIIGAAALPALAVYGPELFPTSMRGRANGGINVVRVVGEVGALLTVGWLIDRVGGLPNALTIMAIGPLLLAVIIIALYPETAHRELEELNPEDHRPPRGEGLTALDDTFEHLHPDEHPRLPHVDHGGRPDGSTAESARGAGHPGPDGR